jgi:4-hydroxymandelate oxidase
MDGKIAPLNLDEYEEAARARVSAMAFDYIAGGSGDGLTLRANRAAFAQRRLLPRVLRGISSPDVRTSVLGRDVALPVLLAPVGFHKLVHPEGEVASARAASSAGTIFVASTASTVSMETIAANADAWWFQLYVFRDRAITRELVQRAEAAGARALVVTVDTPVLGRREADERNRFALPEGLTWANLTDAGLDVMAQTPEGSSLGAYLMRSIEMTLSWHDLDWIASISSLPVIPKGILHPDDALLAIEHGARALVVSNHGGRQLDGAIATLDALELVAQAVAGRTEILLDGGVRRGSDVLKAIALGARAVLIGRPFLWGLAVAGEDGAREVLDLLASEIARDLVLCGCASLDEVGRGLVV